MSTGVCVSEPSPFLTAPTPCFGMKSPRPHPRVDLARHHPELYVATVSPGAVSNTNLLSHGGVSPFLRGIARLSQLCSSYSVQEGAKRYVDILLLSSTNNDDKNNINESTAASGSFLASRKGFTKDFGNIGTLKKGKFVTDIQLQDEAWDAVNKFL